MRRLVLAFPSGVSRLGQIFLASLLLATLAFSSADARSATPAPSTYTTRASLPTSPGDERWIGGFGLLGTDGSINDGISDMALDQSGNIYIVGSFVNAGNVLANHIAKWDGSTWAALGSGTDGAVNAIAIDKSGKVYVGGRFTTAGGTSANNIAMWNGSTWSALGTGIGGTWPPDPRVDALALDSKGNLYVAGFFNSAGPVAAYNVAKWDGAGWSALWEGVQGVSDLVVDGSDNLWAGGDFNWLPTRNGMIRAFGVAKWNGIDWSATGPGAPNYVQALAIDGNGNLYAGGDLDPTVGSTPGNGVAKWNGSSWSVIATAAYYQRYPDFVSALAVDANGILYAGGHFTQLSGVSANSIAKWDGAHWTAFGTGVAEGISSIALVAPDIFYVGGSFDTAGGIQVGNIAKWEGAAWHALGGGGKGLYGGGGYALAADNNGNVYAGGAFGAAGNLPVKNIARWNGTTWSSLDTGPSGAGEVKSIALDQNGNVYAAGYAAGSLAGNIARWDGTHWSSLPAPGNAVNAIVTDGNGHLFAGGTFTTTAGISASHVAVWNGTNWSALGTGTDGAVNALAIDASGNLYAGGDFTTAGGESANHVAKWNGSTWSPLGSGITGSVYPPTRVSALALDSSGNLYAGGFFQAAGGVSANNIAKWNGSTWSALGSGTSGSTNGGEVLTLTADSNGDLYAGGWFASAGGTSANYIAKWDGVNWTPLGSGTNSAVYALALDHRGLLYAGGIFTTAGDKASVHIGRYFSSTPLELFFPTLQ